jgi:hypothetical protein
VRYDDDFRPVEQEEKQRKRKGEKPVTDDYAFCAHEYHANSTLLFQLRDGQRDRYISFPIGRKTSATNWCAALGCTNRNPQRLEIRGVFGTEGILATAGSLAIRTAAWVASSLLQPCLSNWVCMSARALSAWSNRYERAAELYVATPRTPPAMASCLSAVLSRRLRFGILMITGVPAFGISRQPARKTLFQAAREPVL